MPATSMPMDSPKPAAAIPTEAGREIEKIGSTGSAIAYVEIEIRDDSGNRLARRQRRDLPPWTGRSRKAIERLPETAAAFFGDWFRSGDVGYLDADGFLI